VTAAERRQVRLGLETRYHYHELPGPDDFGPLLEEFAGSPLGYWHDTGHAHVNEHMGLVAEGQLLEALSGHLIGVHFHDAQGLDDHLPPGSGRIDFKALASSLTPEVVQVLELRPGTPLEAVRDGLAHLTDCFSP
jgi:sugar phosphate isomerase/epimerase